MKKIVVLMFLVILIISCSSSSRILVKVWTNKPDLPLYAEMFNANQESCLLQVFYVKDLSGELQTSESVPDLVIGDYLNSSDTVHFFQNLDNLFYNEKHKPLGIQAANIYKGLLDLGKSGSSYALLPVCFNIPGFVYLKETETDFIIDLEDIFNSCTDFNKKEGHMAFSYFWKYSAVLNRLAAHGFLFSENTSELLSWDNVAMMSGLEKLSALEFSLNGNIRKITSFYSSYCNAPAYKLLMDKRICYASICSCDYLKIPSDKRAVLDISWLGAGGSIPVNEEITFAGIHKQAVNAKGAKVFLQWLFTEDTQVLLMKQAQMLRLNSFGILGGLSSLRTVNENEIPRLYPDFAGNIPDEKNLHFPSVLPPRWPQIKSLVIVPWLAGYFSNEPGLKPLPDTFRIWKNQHSEE
ncbi:MAG: hypothetical protein JW874_16495 [Spirochaetales bacterium]|nr:hypothetical protein [Spirochaetales bacterium]